MGFEAVLKACDFSCSPSVIDLRLTTGFNHDQETDNAPVKSTRRINLEGHLEIESLSVRNQHGQLEVPEKLRVSMIEGETEAETAELSYSEGSASDGYPPSLHAGLIYNQLNFEKAWDLASKWGLGTLLVYGSFQATSYAGDGIWTIDLDQGKSCKIGWLQLIRKAQIASR